MRTQALASAMSLVLGTAICVVGALAQTATPMFQSPCDVPLVVTRYNPSTQEMRW
jgi:hypothetical protein